ncbi:UDP-2,3-diacylglucosamine diphosphatase [Betaproteobacteria bacterium GR16-43]|nr:UDP-2,3-diacylglucosamine diphosphatase [Betaproteobacteria bacterium GR16-43]
MKGRTLFVSDLHLDESRPGAVERFERFLEREAPTADALYVLGDLFEAWVGDDSLDLPLPARIAKALRAASASTPTSFMHGNRDFLAGERFGRETGAVLLPDPSPIDLYGTPALVLHGDLLCTDDLPYQAFRKQVRDPAWQKATLALPLAHRLKMAETMRAEGDRAKASKSMSIMDVAPASVDQAFRDSGRALMIHGHTHRPARHVHTVDGRECVRWVLPDWYETGGYLEATPSGIRAVSLA